MKCFVISPFGRPFDEYYQNIIVPAARSVGLDVLRADEIYNVHPIMDDIVRGIVNTDVIIAEVTRRNPNVNYELGMAHALGKPVVIISQSVDDIPFDYKHVRAILYDTERSTWASSLGEKLTTTLQAIIKNPRQNFLHKALEEFHKDFARGDTPFLRSREQTPNFLGRTSDSIRDIFIAGPTLMFATYTQSFFRDIVQRGGYVKFLLPDPALSGPALLGLRAHWHHGVDEFEEFLRELRKSLTAIESFKRSIRPDAAGSFEVRYLECSPTLSLLMVNEDDLDGCIKVELLPFKTESTSRPHFILEPKKYKRWYEFFRARCNEMWENAHVLDFKSFDIIELKHT